MKALFLFSLMFPMASMASTKTARTQYWMTKAPESIFLRMVPESQHLTDVCLEYKSSIGWNDGSTPLGKEEIEYLRMDPENLQEDKFSAKFIFDEVTRGPSVAEAVRQANLELESGHGLFPNYNQKLAELQMDYLASSAIDFKLESRSLAGASKKLGLSLHPVQVLRSGSKVYIKVTGRDAACDVLNSKAHVSYETRALAKIGLEEQLKIKSFYADFQELVKEAFAMKRTGRGRAALVGFKAYDLLKKHNVFDDQAESFTEGLVNDFFDNEMNRTALWKMDSNGNYFFEIPGAKEVNPRIILEM